MNKYKTELLERFDKKANCKVGKQCGDICIPKKSECQLSRTQQPPSSLVKGVAVGAGLLGMSTASYLAFRAKYRAGFAESAKMADEMSKNVKVEDISPEQTKITFATGGFYGPMGAEGKKKAEDYFSYKLKTNILDEDHHVITHRNDEFNNPENKALIKVNELAKEGKKPDPLLFAQMSAKVVSDHYKQTLETALVKGRNPEAVKLASEVIAYHRAYPDKEIYLTGHSAGGMINHETAEILNKLNIKANVVNFGSGYFGLTEKVGNSSTIVDRGDFYFKSMAGVRDPIYVGEDKITDENKHSVRLYMNSPEVIKTAKSLFNQKQKTDSASRKKCKVGKPCGDICIPKKNECTSESTSNVQLAGAIATGVGLSAIVIPAVTLAGMRHNYLMKLPESASIAKQRGEGVDSSTLKDFTDKEDIVFFQKGFDSAYGEEVKASGRSKIETQLNSIFPNSGVVVRSNELFNIPEVQTDVPGYKERFLKSAIETMIKPFVTEGRNPESLSLASEVYAYHLKYPGKPINLIGHSAGGMITREASDILNRLGVKHKVAAIASPDFGLFDTKNYIAINSDKDPLNSVLPNFKAVKVNVSGHSGSDYLNDIDTVKMLKNHFGNNMKNDTYLVARTDAIKKAVCKKGKPCGDICIPKKHECESDKPKQVIQKRDLNKSATQVRAIYSGIAGAAALLVVGGLITSSVLDLEKAKKENDDNKKEAREFRKKEVESQYEKFKSSKNEIGAYIKSEKEFIQRERDSIKKEESAINEVKSKMLGQYEAKLNDLEGRLNRYEESLNKYQKHFKGDTPDEQEADDYRNVISSGAEIPIATYFAQFYRRTYDRVSGRRSSDNNSTYQAKTTTTSGKTPWSVLGISQNATESEIKQAYKKLARQNHPDLAVNASPQEKLNKLEKMKEINEAKDILDALLQNKRSDSMLSTQEQIQLQCKIILSRAAKEKIDKISAVKASNNGTLTGFFAIKNKTFKFSIDDKNITYSANSIRIDSFQKYVRYDAKAKKCKIGISCGDACIGSRKKCQLNTSQIAKPSEVSRLRLTASKLFLEQNPVSIPSTQETTKQANNYEVNPNTNKPYTIRELRKIASDRGIYGYGSMPIKELKESLMLADKNPDSSRRIAEGIVKRKPGASKLIDAAGLKGKRRGAERDTKKLVGNLIYSWKRLEALAKFAGNSPIQWSTAAVGAFLLGATARTYEQIKEQYREGLDESAKIAQERAVKINLQHPEESNGKPVIRNGKQVMTSKIKQDNITFAIGSGNGYGAEEMKELLQGGDASDKSEEWLRKSHYVIPFNLQETGSPAIPEEDRNPQVDAANDVINGFGSSMRNWKQKRNQDAVDLAAQIYAHAIAVDQSDGVTLVNKDKKINLLAHGYGGQVTKEALEILARMEVKGSPTGKEVLKQVNAVFLGTPHFGFAENVSNRQRTIISAQDPIAMLPTFEQGARQQWISSVKGHAAKDYLSDTRVRDAVKEAFGYYQGSPEEVRRSQRKERSRIARQRAKVKASKKKENQSEVKPTQEQTNTDAYDIQYQATVSDLKNKLHAIAL